MFQISMSFMHEDEKNQKFDSDSSVGMIEDGLVAIEAFQSYIQQLGSQLGCTFTLTDNDPSDSQVILAASALVVTTRGNANCFVEIQHAMVQDDPERIVKLLGAKAKFTYQQHPTEEV